MSKHVTLHSIILLNTAVTDRSLSKLF